MVSTTLMAFAAGGLQAWLLDFLKKAKGMSEASATSLLGAAFLGGLCGVIAGGRIDYIGRTRPGQHVGLRRAGDVFYRGQDIAAGITGADLRADNG